MRQVDLSDGSSLRFKDPTNLVYIDEKWFIFAFRRLRQRLLEGSKKSDTWHAPTEKNKQNPPKAMFLGAVGFPRPQDGFDGLIKCQGFGSYVSAKRSSHHRPAGTLEWKGYNATAESIFDLITEEGGLLDAIVFYYPGVVEDGCAGGGAGDGGGSAGGGGGCVGSGAGGACCGSGGGDDLTSPSDVEVI